MSNQKQLDKIIASVGPVIEVKVFSGDGLPLSSEIRRLLKSWNWRYGE